MSRRLCIILAASLLLVAAACGADKTDAADTTDQTGKAQQDRTGQDPASGEAAGGGDDGDFCAAAANVGALLESLGLGDYQGMVDDIDAAEADLATYVATISHDLEDEAELEVDALHGLRDAVAGAIGDPDVDTQAMAAMAKVLKPDLEAARDATTAYRDQTCN
jgi:hypothetical protein